MGRSLNSGDSMEYTIVQGSNVSEVISEVECWLDRGWQCQGGVFILERDNAKYYAQAMIKVDK